MPSHHEEVHFDDDLMLKVENYIKGGEADTQVQLPEGDLPPASLLLCAWSGTLASCVGAFDPWHSAFDWQSALCL